MTGPLPDAQGGGRASRGRPLPLTFARFWAVAREAVAREAVAAGLGETTDPPPRYWGRDLGSRRARAARNRRRTMALSPRLI
ncbi:hypothetical protein M569_11159 [Genlisea aurea]|uniref:Uncharacterized protein n=1 Tax=Genlisea aurea TaxID=192259 RepID=S8C9Z0_9LAMI|nr:hypothetical protein M569_11159 [Genlisea aurea]